MKPLYNQHGRVYAWFEQDSGDILDLRGRHIAFVDDDSVYSYAGRHIGWWKGDHVRDRSGAVAAFLEDAEDLGVFKPFTAFPPFPPLPSFPPFRPFTEFKPFPPFDRWGWSDRMPF